MKRRKLRTFVVALALIVGVALVGALLNLVDTQRQFSVQSVGAQTGGYDLSITKSDIAQSALFEWAKVDRIVRDIYAQVVGTYPRIQGIAEARSSSLTHASSVTLFALNVETDQLAKVTPDTGTYPPQHGQVFLTQPAADALGIKVGDEVTLSYVRPTPRVQGKAASKGGSTARAESRFLVGGIGVASGLNASTFVFGKPIEASAIVRLDDAQQWLGAPSEAERLLVVWNSDTGAGTNAQAAVSHARDVGTRVRDAVQAQLGRDYTVGLAKYQRLDETAQGFVFQQSFITLYGLLSMGIIGLMVNALMTTTVNEQKVDLAILRVIGAPRARLFEALVLEVILLGIVGIGLGLFVGRAINDYITTPLLTASLNLPAGVRPEWTLNSVLTPTLITVGVLALATISPARQAANTKVMIVLNPAAADQPTLDDLAKLRERHANYNLLVTGLILLAFCGVVLIVFPVLFSFGDQNALATVFFTAFLLMVIGMSLVFYFITTPLERGLIGLYNVLNPRAAFFAGRYALRGKGRNALISLMVVASAVLPTLLATQLALTDANIETDLRFSRGASASASPVSSTNEGPVKVVQRTIDALSDTDLAEVQKQGGIAAVVGVASGYHTEASDRVSLRTAQVNLVGVPGDLNTVLFPEFMQWAQGDASALTRISQDPDAVVISLGLSELLDLRLSDTIRIKGNGFDHERIMRIVAVGQRLPGFGDDITRNRNSAQGGQTGVLMNLDAFRDLRHDPDNGPLDKTEALYGRALIKLDPAVDQVVLSRSLRETLGDKRGITFEITSELLKSVRAQLQQGRIFIVLLTGLSMVTAVFGVLAVMYTAVLGRRLEIGMLKAIGSPGRSLYGIFVGEAIVTTLAAALAGIIAGTVLGYAFELSQRFSNESVLLPAFDFGTAGVILLMVCLAAIISALMATRPVIRQKAIKILREK